MKKDKLNWLFFDIGSTLVDESACNAFRIHCLAAQEGAPSEEAISGMMRGLIGNHASPYKAVTDMLGLKKADWPSHMEKLYPGVKELLDDLHRRYRLGIIANQAPGTEARLAGFGIRDYFDIIVASAEEGVAKPAPEIFLRAMKYAGCQPDEAAMIGDRPDNDIIPAAGVGMRTIWVKQGMYASVRPDEVGFSADMTVDSITCIQKYL